MRIKFLLLLLALLMLFGGGCSMKKDRNLPEIKLIDLSEN